jgi:hypothetical protein
VRATMTVVNFPETRQRSGYRYLATPSSKGLLSHFFGLSFFSFLVKSLHFLAVAARPVVPPELADFIAIDIEKRRVDVDVRFQDAREILTITQA